MCKVLPALGKDMCPRHEFLSKANADLQLEKQRKALLGRNYHGPRANTRRELIAAGYQYIGNDTCACGEPLEWWRTPNQKKAPFDPMATVDSAARSHFAKCNRAFESFLRRSA